MDLVGKRKSLPDRAFIGKLMMIDELYDKVNELGLDHALINEARKNGIINLVTGLEVLFKDIIIEYSGAWDKEGVDSLMKDNISLKDAFLLSRIPEIKEEHVIAKSYNFQNFSIVTLVFSKLCGEDIVKGLTTYMKKGDPKVDTFFYDQINWLTKIEALLNARHEIIHNGVLDVSESDYQKYYRIALEFGSYFSIYLLQRRMQISQKSSGNIKI